MNEQSQAIRNLLLLVELYIDSGFDIDYHDELKEALNKTKQHE